MTLDEEREAGRQAGRELAASRVRTARNAMRYVDSQFPFWVVSHGRDQAGPHLTTRWEAYKSGFMEGHTQ